MEKVFLKNVLHYKSPAFGVIILVAVAAVAIGLLGSPRGDELPPPTDESTASEQEATTQLANRLMQEAHTVFWWYHGDLSDELEIDLEAEPLTVDGQQWQRVGRFETMAELKAATEAVFTPDFCKANLYDKIDELGKFKEIDGVLYHNGNVGGMGWIYSLPKEYTVLSSNKDKLVLTAVCDGLNPDINAPEDTIEYQFELTLIRDSDSWKLSDYYNYSSEGYGSNLERVNNG